MSIIVKAMIVKSTNIQFVHIMKKYIVLILISMLGTFSAYSQKTLSLQECVDFALKNHLNNILSENEILLSKQKEREALAAYLPQVNGNITFDDNLKRQVSIIPAGAFSPTEIRLQFGTQYATSGMVQLEQTIYDKSLLVGIKAVEPNNKVAVLKKEQTQENLIYNTANAYFQVLVYVEQEKITLENEKKYRELLEILKLRVEKGVIKKTDYDRAKATLNNILSQKSIIQANKNVALNRLKNAMGMSLSELIEISEVVNYESIIQVEKDKSLDYDNLIDYKIQHQNILLQEFDVKRKQAAFLPTASMYARYGAQSFGNEFSSSFSRWFDYSSAGFKVNIPIFSGYKKNSLLQ